MSNYTLEIRLIDKTAAFSPPVGHPDLPSTRTLTTDGDLSSFFNSIEYHNKGNPDANSVFLNLDVPPDGLFVRKAPILIREDAKNDYLVLFQITQQSGRQQGSYKSQKFIGELGQPQVAYDESNGETVTIPLIGIEYALQEFLTSSRSIKYTPKSRAISLILDANKEAGIGSNSVVIIQDDNFELPEDISLKQDWKPYGPIPITQALQQIIDTSAIEPASGGTFTDYYIDYEAGVNTREVKIIAQRFGELPILDEDVPTINPIEIGPEGADGEQDQSRELDNIEFKNLIILKGDSTGSSLPMDHTRFESNFVHGLARERWSPDVIKYYGENDPNGNPQSLIRIYDEEVRQIRFFTCTTTHDSSRNNGPLGSSTNTTPWNRWFEDFAIVPEWTADGTYFTGNIITYSTDAIRFYEVISKFPQTPGSLAPNNPGSAGQWRVIEHRDWKQNCRAPFTSYTPWTTDLTSYKLGLAGVDSEGEPSDPSLTEDTPHFVGYSVDWNIGRAIYDRDQPDDYEQRVGTKWVTRIMDIPPTGSELFDGQHILVGNGAEATANAWGNPERNGIPLTSTQVKNRVAHYVYRPGAGISDAHWDFSEEPFDDENADPAVRKQDTLHDLSTGKVLKWNKTTVTWDTAWSLLSTDVFHPFEPSVFHPISRIRLVEGATGIPAQAIESTFEWQYEGIIGLNLLGTTNREKKLLASNGAWWNIWFPYPRLGHNIGEIYGRDLTKPLIDFDNLDNNARGEPGWNNGIDTEDLGNLSAISFKIKHSQWKGALEDGAGSNLTLGIIDIPYILWFIDKFDRVAYQTFTIPFNGFWETFTLPAGPNGGMQLYHSRLDEYTRRFGVTIAFDFALKELEFTGIEFDWRFVKGMGIFYAGTFSDGGLYEGSTHQALNSITQAAQQVYLELERNALSLFLGNPKDQSIYADNLTHHCNLAIDELYFVKETYITSSRTTGPEGIADPRVMMVPSTTVDDYNTGVARATAILARQQFYPQNWHIRASGDVRIRVGNRFFVDGPRILDGPYELVCNQVTHTINNDGYWMDINAKRKFIHSG